MHTLITTIKRSILPVFIIALFAIPNEVTFAQETSGEILGGTEYWLGVPHCRKETNEPIRGDYPVVLWLSSKVETSAEVSTLKGQHINVKVYPNQITQVPLPDIYMHRENETVRDNGIYVKSQDPINVAVYLSYKWSGEAYRVTPVEWLGTEYVTLNMYQDRTDEYKPAQILIIATEDGTTVKYKPTWHTPQTEAGRWNQVKLQRGETYLIEGLIEPAYTQDWASDLTGTIIESNHPVAVLSGHTKGAFPRYSRTMLGRPANFMRNMLIDMMWPNALLGKEYVSAPVKYADRERGKISEDEGDLIRVVAIEDNTELSTMRDDGNGFKVVHPSMKKGEWYNFTNQELAAVYRASKPVLVGQYGKTWWLRAVNPEVEDNSNKNDGSGIQNPPRNGQGMMLVLAPQERWCSWAGFRSPQDIDNFVYLTFKAEDAKNLYFDGQSFIGRFGNSFGYIPGTDYAYLTEQVSASDHYIEGKEGARFAGYAYGNWDRSKDGFAYGYPIGINYATPCQDSLFVLDTIICGDVTGTAYSVPEDAECAGLFRIRFISQESDNYRFEVDEFEQGVAKEVEYRLFVENPEKEAYGVVEIMTKSGKIIRKTYEYVPEQIAFNPEELDYGLMSIGNTICKTFKINNPGRTEVTVHELYLKFDKNEFDVDVTGIPVTLQPGEEAEIEICATALIPNDEPVRDTVFAKLTCYERRLIPLELRTGEPIVWIGDADFGNVIVGREKSLPVMIENRGDVEIVITDLTWPDADKVQFPRIEDISFPIILQKGEDTEFTTFYSPDVEGVQHTTTATMDVNATQIKTESYWKGIGIFADLLIEGYSWNEKRVMDGFEDPQVTADGGYPGVVYIENTRGNSMQDIVVTIQNNSDNLFSIVAPNQIPAVLQGGERVAIDVLFSPTATGSFTRDIIATGSFQGIPVQAPAAQLIASAGQPRMSVTDYDFGSILAGTTIDGEITISNTSNSEYGDGDWLLTIFNGLEITGTNADMFEIDPSFFTVNQYPIEINELGQSNIIVPITFNPTIKGTFTASLVNNNDVPDGLGDKEIGNLVGEAYLPGVNTTDAYLGLHYRGLTSDIHTVNLINTGNTAVTISEPFNSPVGQDYVDFNVVGWRIKNSLDDLVLPGTENINTPFDLGENQYLEVDVTFTPSEERDNSDGLPKFLAQIEYKLEIDGEQESRFSNITGDGMLHYIVVKVDKGYELSPNLGEKLDIAVKLAPESTESKNLQQAQVTEVKIRVYYPQAALESLVMFSFNPDMTYTSTIDEIINTSGLLLDGWTIETYDLDQLDHLYVKFVSPDPNNVFLTYDNANEATLFEFRVFGRLATLNTYDLNPDIDVLKPYVIDTQINGDISNSRVCVQDIRPAITSGVEYSLIDVAPNPVNKTTTINYSVGIEAPTSLELFNSFGERVAVLVDERLKPNEYTVDLNVDELGLSTGTYYFRLNSGPYSATRKMIILK